MLLRSWKSRRMSTPEGADDQGSFVWMVPYSTLMLVLMIMFCALYSYSSTNRLEYESAISGLGGSGASGQEIELAKSLKDFIRNMHMEGLAEVSVTPHSIKLKLSSPVVFDSASAELKPDIMPLLIGIFDQLKGMDNMIIVEGHTDNVPLAGGRYKNNWELSAARAFSVIDFYIQRGIDPSRLVAYGYGENRPLYPNSTALGRAINRRIEIIFPRGGAQ